jgi:hypothetical protein
MRLHVLLSAGGVRLAFPAERVRRVRAETGDGLSLAEVLGLPPVAPAAALDVEAFPAPLLVDRVIGAVDTSRSVPVRLPAASRDPGALFDRALLLDGELFLELQPERLAAGAPVRPSPPAPGPLAPLPVPAVALVFPVGERRFAAPFGIVLGVLEGPRLHPVPRAPACHRGVTVHAGALVSVQDLPAALGEPPGPDGRYAVLVEGQAGAVGLVATAPGRVVAGLAADGESEPAGRWLRDPAGERIFLPRYDRLPVRTGDPERP